MGTFSAFLQPISFTLWVLPYFLKHVPYISFVLTLALDTSLRSLDACSEEQVLETETWISVCSLQLGVTAPWPSEERARKYVQAHTHIHITHLYIYIVHLSAYPPIYLPAYLPTYLPMSKPWVHRDSSNFSSMPQDHFSFLFVFVTPFSKNEKPGFP